MCDASIDRLPDTAFKFNFEKLFLGSKLDNKYIGLEEWINSKVGKHVDNLLLQMDIEGGEWDVIINADKQTLKRFNILVIEFHDLETLFDRKSIVYIESCFRKILDDFYIVYIHPNNCCGTYTYGNFEVPGVMEMTFVNKKIMSMLEGSSLRDYDPTIGSEIVNVEANKKIKTPDCWWRKV